MDPSIIVVGIIVLFVGVIFTVIFSKRKNNEDPALELLQRQIQEIARSLDQRIGESSRFMHETVRSQFSESANIIRDVTERLTILDETNKQVIGFADQLQSLQDILKNPKQRGVLGEYYLETVLKNILPVSAYQLQYKLGKDDGGHDLIVDAVIKLKEKVIPIDSKFSLENYNRLVEEKNAPERERLEKLFKQDLKLRIDETAKYVRPEFGTLDFALMFIPSETIYYELTINQVGTVKLNTDDLIQYAVKKHVHIVSPNSFYAFLQTILHGLKQLQIEESTREIIGKIADLGRHINAYDEFMSKLGNSLGTTVNHYNTAYKELKKIDKDIYRITGEAPGVEAELLDRPEAL